MENWRKFSTSIEVSHKSNVLVEGKNYKGSLRNLVKEYKNKNISKKQYSDILIESIERDFKELESLTSNKDFLVEGALFDKLKGVVKGAVSTGVQKVADIIEKINSLILASKSKALEMISRAAGFIKNFEKANPKLAQAIKTVLAIAALAAIAYIIFSPSTAQAAVSLPATMARPPVVLDPSSPEGQSVIRFLTTHADTIGLGQENADKFITLIKQKNTVELNKGLTDILQEVRALAERQDFMDQFKPVTDKSLELANAALQAGGDLANKGASFKQIISDPSSVRELMSGFKGQIPNDPNDPNLSSLLNYIANKANIPPDKTGMGNSATLEILKKALLKALSSR
jgi:hypothetical protein